MIAVDPFVAGVFCTLFAEMAFFIIYAIISSSRKGK